LTKRIEIWYSSSTKKVVVGILISNVKVNFEGHFLLCPYKMRYFPFGLIVSKFNEVVCSQDYKKKHQAKKVNNMPKWCFSDFGVKGQI